MMQTDFNIQFSLNLKFCFFLIIGLVTIPKAYAACNTPIVDDGKPTIIFNFEKGYANTRMVKFKFPIFDKQFPASFEGALKQLGAELTKAGVPTEEKDYLVSQAKSALPLESEFHNQARLNLRDIKGIYDEKCCPIGSMKLGFTIKRLVVPNPQLPDKREVSPMVSRMLILGCPPPESIDSKNEDLVSGIQTVCFYNQHNDDTYLDKSSVVDLFRGCRMQLKKVTFQGPEKFRNFTENHTR